MAVESFILSPPDAAGITEYFHFDWDTGEERLELVQDARQALSDIQDKRNGESISLRGEMVHVGSIPLSVYYALPDHIRKDRKAFKKWLNLQENKDIFLFDKHIRI